MALTIKLKGKKRALDDTLSIASIIEPPKNEPPHPTKRAKRAETRQCPVCDEHIPLRLLSMHAELETARVEEVIRKVGSSELYYDEIDDEPGPSSRPRRSAVKARKSITRRGINDALEQSDKIIQAIKRRRKQRHTKLKEMAKEEAGNHEDLWLGRFTGEEIACPVCSMMIRGDRDVVDAHVDACLAHEARRREDTLQRELQHRRDLEEENWDDDDGRISNYVGNVRGVGFHSRVNNEDVDEEIDIDGDDQAFGEAQFTEVDVVPVNRDREDVEDVEVNIEDDFEDEVRQDQKSLRDLITIGNSKNRADKFTSVADPDNMDLAVIAARRRGDRTGLILALENKIKQLESGEVSCSTSLLCRICLDPYTEPAVSTGCWHTCCGECWLRCLGSTKLCPICKRITGATDLRRVYL